MKNSAYWKKRYEQLEKTSYQKGVEFYQKLDDQYVNAASQIDKEIRAWYQRFAINNNVSITEAKKMLDKEELKELKWTVNEYIKYGEENAIDGRFMKQLENASARYHISRLEALKLNTQNVIEKLYGNQTDEITDFIKNIYTDNMFHSMYELQKGFNIGWNFSGIDEKKLDKLISIPWTVDRVNFSDRIWQNKTKLLNELSNELTSMCLTGKSPDTAIKNISKKLNVAKSRAKSIIYTESSHFQSQSDRDTLKEFGCEKYEILATLDSHTSEICQEMDGKVFDLKNFETGVSAPPFHPYCRTVIVPAFDDDFDVGERAARGEDGKTYYIPDDITYPEWKKAFVDGNHEGFTEFSKEGKKHFEKKDEKYQFTSNVAKVLEKSNVEYIDVLKHEKSLSDIEIINYIGGGDMTKGSCASLSFAYAGNKVGLNVLDFRGGNSQSIFSRTGSIFEIAKLDGVKATFAENYNDVKNAVNLLKDMEMDKEFVLVTGKHAAIVKHTNDGYLYLELQSATDNGFKKLNTKVLKKRFGCTQSCTISGMKFKQKSCIIDIESLGQNKEFQNLLGYINTAQEKQKKGMSGHVK